MLKFFDDIILLYCSVRGMAIIHMRSGVADGSDLINVLVGHLLFPFFCDLITAPY